MRGGESEQPPQGEGRGGHGEKRRHEAEVVVVVEPGDGLAHRVDAVAEGEEGVDVAEEVGHELDGVEARRARDLDDDEEDGGAAANVAERGDDGVDDPRVGDPDGDCGGEKGRDGLHLHPEGHVAERHHDGLEHRERGEEEEAAEVGLADGEAAEALGVDLDAEDDRQHERADPQGQVGEEGGHGTAVVLRGEEGLLLDGDGRGDVLADLRGVEVRDSVEGRRVGGGQEGVDVGLGGAGAVGKRAEVTRDLVEDAEAGRELVVNPGEQGGRFLAQGTLAAQRAAHGGDAAGGLRERGVDRGHGLAELLARVARCGVGVGGRGLEGVTELAYRRQRRARAAVHVVQAVEDGAGGGGTLLQRAGRGVELSADLGR